MENIHKRITLIRHGEPEANEEYSAFALVAGEDIKNFLKKWNRCELSSRNEIPASLKEIIKSGDFYISSDLKRTKQSFQMLGVNEFETNELFNEARLPHGIGKSIKLPFVFWLIALRILWRFGLSSNSESYKDFTDRIKEGTDMIEENRDVNHTILMAHGFVNRFLKKELLRRGWKLLSKKGGHGFWSYSTFGQA
ncbi:MAG: phosphoglycerate mutase family protein [Fibrobacter sp.]|nr:phosphoglycerate mutase family protein [Fibrobacter sp.]